MNRKILIALLAGAAMATPAMAQRDDALQMVSIDVEGGGGTLFVTPHGKSVLIDSGNPERGDHPNSENIEKAARQFGLKKIDYLITTHYHVDHLGGIEGLLKRIPVGTFIDHGENREVPGTQGPGGMIGPDWRTVGADGKPQAGRDGQIPAAPTEIPPPNSTAGIYAHYIKLIEGRPHRVVKPGDRLSVDGMNILFVAADAKMIPKPLPGAGEKVAECATMPGMASNGGEENTRSVASVITYGKVKIGAFGDLTWDREKDLFCPVDKVGKIDVFLDSHHGTQWSGSPAMLNSLQPIVTIMGNSSGKGDDPERAKTIQANPRYQALWRLHAGRGKAAVDGDLNMIANADLDAAKDGRYNLRLRIRPNGEITVINERNGYNKAYHIAR